MEILKLETETCTRCGGSGEHSYMAYYGSRCFKCNGAGWKFTGRGAAARKFLIEICSSTFSECKAGDKVSIKFNKGFGMVEAVTKADEGFLNVTISGKSYLFKADQAVYIYSEENLKAASEYQDKLTKHGKLRKKYQNGGAA